MRAKLTFLRLLVLDRRLPWYIRALPLAVLVYWISPLDLIPLFPFDDIAFALLLALLAPRLVGLSNHPLPDTTHPWAIGIGVVQADEEVVMAVAHHLLHIALL